MAKIRIVVEIEAPDTVVEALARVIEKLVEHAAPEKAPTTLSLEVSDVSGRITLRATQVK